MINLSCRSKAGIDCTVQYVRLDHSGGSRELSGTVGGGGRKRPRNRKYRITVEQNYEKKVLSYRSQSPDGLHDWGEV